MELAEIDEALRRLDRSRNAAVQGLYFVKIMQDDPSRDFVWIEDRLRQLDCRLLYLLGMPAEQAAPGMRIFDPRNPAAAISPRFWVWHSVNGPAERELTMRDAGITGNLDNRQRLAVAGYLAPIRQ